MCMFHLVELSTLIKKNYIFFCFEFYSLGRRHFGSLFINEEQNKGWLFTCLRVFAIHSGLVYDVIDTDY